MKILKGIVLLSVMVSISCGPLIEVREGAEVTGEPATPAPIPTPPPSPPPSSDVASYDEAMDLLEQYCAQCHSNSPWLNGNELDLKRSTVQIRVQNNTMPPPISNIVMPDEDRERLLTYPF